MAFEMPDRSGRVTFVTGTTSGVGRAFALSLAECGCDVVSTGKMSEDDDYDDDRDLAGSIERTACEGRERGAESIAIQLADALLELVSRDPDECSGNAFFDVAPCTRPARPTPGETTSRRATRYRSRHRCSIPSSSDRRETCRSTGE